MRTSSPPVRDEPTVRTAQESTAPVPRRRSWPAALISMVAVGGLFTMLFLRNHRFAFIDDRQADGVAKLMDMGRILQSGEWPWLSTHVVNSGGYAIEYQNGVFNPVNLGFGVLMAHLSDAAFASFLQVLFHLLVTTAAAAWLATSLGLRTPWAIAFAVSVGFQPYTVFWGAGWYQAPVSFSWFVLAVAAAVALHRTGHQRHGWLLLVSVYLLCQSGWPLAIPVLGLFVVALAVSRVVARQPRGTTIWILLWSAAGGVVSLIGLYPLITSMSVATRSTAISNDANFNVTPFEGLLHFADPSYAAWFVNFDGYRLQTTPTFYIAWFVLPVLVFWRPAWASLGPQVRVLYTTAIAMLGFSVLGALGPEHLYLFRFPTRFVQYWGFFLLVVAALLVAHGRFTFTRRRAGVLGGLVVLQTVNALQSDPGHPVRIIGLNALVGVACLAFVWMCAARGRTAPARPAARLAPARWGGLVAAVATVVTLLAVAYVHPMGRGSDWGFPNDLSTVRTLSQRDYTLFYGTVPPLADAEELPSPAPEVAGYYAEYHASSMGLLVGDRTINGYSPIGDRFLTAHVPLDDQGNFAESGARQFTAVDPQTGLTWLDLLRVDQIITDLGPRDQQLQQDLDSHWRRVSQGQYTATYRRVPYSLPGLVSYAAPGVRVGAQEPCPMRNSQECVQVTNTGSGPAQVVFARLWFPGYSATLDGKPIDVVRHQGTLVAVDLPPGASGRLVISYRSPGFVPLAALAIAVILGMAVAQVVAGRRSRSARRRGEDPAEPGRAAEEPLAPTGSGEPAAPPG